MSVIKTQQTDLSGRNSTSKKQAVSQQSLEKFSTPGAMLHNARLEKGFTTEFVCNELGFISSYLDALETDDHKILRAPAYVRGYIRRYCDLLELPADTVLASYEKNLALQAKKADEAQRESAALGNVAGKLPRLPNLGMLTTFNTSSWAFPIGLCVLALVLVLLIPSSNVPLIADEISASSSAAGSSKSQTLEIRLEKPVWVEVTDADGDILAADFARAGSYFNLSGRAPFQLKLDSANGVNVRYQQQPIHLDVNSRDNTVQMKVGG